MQEGCDDWDESEPDQKLAELEPDRTQACFAQSAAEVASKKIALLRARAQLSRKHRDRLSAFAAGLGFATAQAMALSSLDRGKVM